MTGTSQVARRRIAPDGGGRQMEVGVPYDGPLVRERSRPLFSSFFFFGFLFFFVLVVCERETDDGSPA